MSPLACPTCRQFVSDEALDAGRCPYCGHDGAMIATASPGGAWLIATFAVVLCGVALGAYLLIPRPEPIRGRETAATGLPATPPPKQLPPEPERAPPPRVASQSHHRLFPPPGAAEEEPPRSRGGGASPANRSASNSREADRCAGGRGRDQRYEPRRSPDSAGHRSAVTDRVDRRPGDPRCVRARGRGDHRHGRHPRPRDRETPCSRRHGHDQRPRGGDRPGDR